MPLARAAMWQQGVDIFLAPTWDDSEVWLSTLRHIAREGRVFVVGTNSFLTGADVPRTLPGADAMYGGQDDLMSRGGSAIVGPDGRVLEGPLFDRAGMLVTTIDLAELAEARRQFDAVGHYARPDVLRLEVHPAGTTWSGCWLPRRRVSSRSTSRCRRTPCPARCAGCRPSTSRASVRAR